MRIGLAKNDITPRVGVDLCGFGPYIHRRSVFIRERLFARALAVEVEGKKALLVSCDLLFMTASITARVREIIAAQAGLDADAVMVHAIHSHSGPNTDYDMIGWGEPDAPYIETLPQRIAQAGLDALGRLQDAALCHAEVACEGIGYNREYEKSWPGRPPLEKALREDWRPASPELTDTTCHVIRFDDLRGGTLGFVSYFGCHPVVCCEDTHRIHGDFPGVATNLLERETPGSVGLFLQGAHGDVNTCVVHHPEQDSLLALDVIAGRYARAVRAGLRLAAPVEVPCLRYVRRAVSFTPKPWDLAYLRGLLAQKEARVRLPGATDAGIPLGPEGGKPEYDVRMETVYLEGLRRVIARVEAGRPLLPPTQVQGLRLGPISFLGSPCETFQAIKNDVKAAARSPLPLVMSTTNDSAGYATDKTTAARGGYAADIVPLMLSRAPFAKVHEELVEALLAVDAELQ
jgi:hypothetical protein